MKATGVLALCCAAGLVLAGCKVVPEKQKEAPPAQTQAAEKISTPPLARDLLMRQTDALLEFRWTGAPELALAPVLLADLRQEAQTARDAARKEAQAAKADAEKSGYPFFPHYLFISWKEEAETPHLLAFSGKTEFYTGGAHGMSGFESALYDRLAEKRIRLADLLMDAKAFYAAMTPQWCKALDDERARKRGDMKLDPMFNDCPPLQKQVVVPDGVDRISGFRVLVAPYEAGPYSEGTYDVLLPLPDNPRKFIRPAYQDAFQIG